MTILHSSISYDRIFSDNVYVTCRPLASTQTLAKPLQDEVSDGRPGPKRDDMDEEPPRWNEMDDEDEEEPSDGSGKGVQQVRRIMFEDVVILSIRLACLIGRWECLWLQGLYGYPI